MTNACIEPFAQYSVTMAVSRASTTTPTKESTQGCRTALSMAASRRNTFVIIDTRFVKSNVLMATVVP
tara:strand:- start:120 stop:323 length:204 start_codon:yes stop_codon:yes gene_type:complete